MRDLCNLAGKHELGMQHLRIFTYEYESWMRNLYEFVSKYLLGTRTYTYVKQIRACHARK